jgi:hypothetical protein
VLTLWLNANSSECTHKFGVSFLLTLFRAKLAFVFYVVKENVELAKTLTKGLLSAKADGSFNRLFERYFKTLFERLDLPNRRVIELNNPLLPKEMLDMDDHFWISPKSLLN